MSGVDFNPKKMNNATLAAAWEIVDKGRLYDGVEEDRLRIGREMARRLRDGVDDD